MRIELTWRRFYLLVGLGNGGKDQAAADGTLGCGSGANIYCCAVTGGHPYASLKGIRPAPVACGCKLDPDLNKADIIALKALFLRASQSILCCEGMAA